MRDLTTEEIGHVYGAGGNPCHKPPEHACNDKKSKSKCKDDKVSKESKGSKCYIPCPPVTCY